MLLKSGTHFIAIVGDSAHAGLPAIGSTVDIYTK